MKQIKIYIIMSLALLGANCSDDFLDREPQDQISSDTFWKSENDVELALNGCYAYVGASVYDAYLDAYADNSYCQYPWESNATIISAGTIDANMNDGYDYTGIRRFNYFLDNIDKAPVSDQVKKQYKSEVRVLRAWSYYNLSKKFGAVPLITNFFIEGKDVAIAPTAEADVMNFVISELDDVIDDLPIENVYKSRVSKGAALALKSRIHLFNQQWAEAASAAERVMGLGYELFKVTSLSAEDLADDYSGFVDFETEEQKQQFYLGLASYQKLFWEAHEGNNEVIMEAEYMPESAYAYSSGINTIYLADNAGGGWSSVTPTQSLVDAYWTSEGTNFTAPSKEHRAAAYNAGDYSDDYLEEFKNRDTRLYASILFPGAQWNDLQDNFVFSWNKGGSNISKTGYNYRKMVDPSESAQSGQYKGPQNFPIIRYAEVLLTFAEAKNEVAGPSGEIYDAIDAIRLRAGMPAVNRAEVSSKEALRSLIRNERRIELAGEGFRWDDIRRWGISQQVMTSIYSIDNDLAQQRRYDPKFIRLPYPQTALDRNPNLMDAQEAKGY